MKLQNYTLCYFLGIGGIGMSALARFFNHFGKKVAGYDKTPTTLTQQLTNEGIECHFNDDVPSLKQMLAGYATDEVLVIYTPAVPADHGELNYLRDNGYRVIKRSQALGEISSDFRTIAIGGTHGKTTTTTMVTHILRAAGVNCFSFMGGISKNYSTNLLLGDASSDAWMVVEADEYDRSFLTLEPQIAVVTSSDADHLDIYKDASHVREGYLLFTRRVRENGTLIVKKNVDNDLRLTGKRLVYSLNLDTDYCAGSVVVGDGRFNYDVKSPVASVRNVSLGVPGLHNVENSIAAIAVAQAVGVEAEVIADALRSFEGVKRRFEYRVKSDRIVLIDDYAHHPEELKATIGAARQLYPQKKITGIFQPHLFSRTRDFADEFAASLSLLDECILMEIYPAREKPIEGVTSAWLLSMMTLANRSVMTAEQIIASVKERNGEVVLMMGAGSIGEVADKAEEALRSQIEKNKL
jgi:UDP-N-acetylmuramate--alanine ligase